MLPGNFTRGAKRLNNGGDKGEGGGGGGSGEADNDNDAEVTYFSPAKDEYAGDDVIATRVAEEVRSVNPTIEIHIVNGFKLQILYMMIQRGHT